MIKQIDYKEKDAAIQFARSLRSSGFAIIMNHPIQKSDMDDLYTTWLNFFHAEHDHKNQFLYDPETVAGYIPAKVSEVAKGYTVKDLKELYHYFPNKECPAAQKPISTKLMKELTDVAQILLSWLQKESPDEVKNKYDRKMDLKMQF